MQAAHHKLVLYNVNNKSKKTAVSILYGFRIFAYQKKQTLIMRLSELKTGERGVIAKVYGTGSFRKRIVEMGFIKGKTVKVVLNAPLHDPIVYEIIGYKISLRREEANMIEIISEHEARLANQQSANLKPIVSHEQQISPSGTDNDEPHIKLMRRLADERGKNIKVALVGNPNCGKTSLYNIASGSHEHVGNYSGVTVDAKEGNLNYNGYHFTIVDLPGTYSLSAYSPEEIYVRRQLIEKTPDIIINIIDATNMERNLYLTMQLLDMNIPMVIALNMYDELEKSGDEFDYKSLAYMLGVPIIPTVGRTGEGLHKVFDAVVNVYNGNDEISQRHIHVNHGAEIEQSINKVRAAIGKNDSLRSRYSLRYLSIKLLENDSETEKIINTLTNRNEIIAVCYEEKKRLEKALGESSESAIIDAKYGFISGALKETFHPKEERRNHKSISERIDAVVTHKILGYPLFFAVLYIMFEATFTLGNYPMEWIDWIVQKVGEFVATNMEDGPLKDLTVDGIIGGVGSVIVFLPNILILYFFISLLEDTGYMARAAFIMDKLMHKMGLHGKSFIPMVMGFGCNVPAIMASRTIESPQSRLVTMLVTPLMSCSARLPIYIVIIGAFFPENASIVMLSVYTLGIIMAVIMARIFSKLLMKKGNLPFVMELPPYRIPTQKSIFRHTWEKGRQYLRKMGGIILICSIFIWFLGYFPRSSGLTTQQQQENSYLCKIGQAIEPVMKPLGFDWQMDVGIIAGVGAKELIVSSLGVMYSNEKGDLESGKETSHEETHSDDTYLQQALSKSTTPQSAIAYLVFVLLYFPCLATIVAIKNESGKWKWALFTAGYTTLLAYTMSFIAYRIALLF